MISTLKRSYRDLLPFFCIIKQVIFNFLSFLKLLKKYTFLYIEMKLSLFRFLSSYPHFRQIAVSFTTKKDYNISNSLFVFNRRGGNKVVMLFVHPNHQNENQKIKLCQNHS